VLAVASRVSRPAPAARRPVAARGPSRRPELSTGHAGQNSHKLTHRRSLKIHTFSPSPCFDWRVSRPRHTPPRTSSASPSRTRLRGASRSGRPPRADAPPRPRSGKDGLCEFGSHDCHAAGLAVAIGFPVSNDRNARDGRHATRGGGMHAGQLRSEGPRGCAAREGPSYRGWACRARARQGPGTDLRAGVALRVHRGQLPAGQRAEGGHVAVAGAAGVS
jgi:hypothetical protein